MVISYKKKKNFKKLLILRKILKVEKIPKENLNRYYFQHVTGLLYELAIKRGHKVHCLRGLILVCHKFTAGNNKTHKQERVYLCQKVFCSKIDIYIEL